MKPSKLCNLNLFSTDFFQEKPVKPYILGNRNNFVSYQVKVQLTATKFMLNKKSKLDEVNKLYRAQGGAAMSATDIKTSYDKLHEGADYVYR